MRAPPVLIAACLALAACGGEAESAAGTTPVASVDPAADPWERIPPDSLYGATAAENLRTVPVVIDALTIPAGWDGMRIAAISDLQLGLWPDNEEVAAAAIRAPSPPIPTWSSCSAATSRSRRHRRSRASARAAARPPGAGGPRRP